MADPTPVKYREWLERQEEYRKQVLTKAKNKGLFKNRVFFGEGERVGRILAMIARANALSSIIPAIRSEGGRITRSASEIVNDFKNYYKSLYGTSHMNVEGEMWDFFKELRTLSLSKENREGLEAPLTLIRRPRAQTVCQ